MTAYTTGQRVSYNSTIWEALANNTGKTPGTDIEKWKPISYTAGDNRNQKLVQSMVDITLYHLHSRIAPRNVPQLRVKRYDDAILYLESCSKGLVSLNLETIQPNQGSRISGGSEPKRINRW